MPLLIKPRTLGCLTKVERRPGGASLIVSAFAFFDLAEADRHRLQGEQAMWLMIAKEMPPGAIFDIGMPKPTAEILLAGHAAAPGGEPVERMGLAFAFGGLQKQLLVTGDRYWRLAGASAVPTEPAPFTQMPLAPERCFGGAGHALNPVGVGYRAQERLAAGEMVALPNIETPETAIRSIGDQPAPPRFGPLAVDAKERLQYAGTYDAAWMKTHAPGLAADADPRFFLFAPPDQRLAGYLNGDEGYGLRNFSADAPEIRQRLPGFRVRSFVGWSDPQKPMTELPMKIDTFWLFAGARRGVLVYRGATPVEDIEGADVADIMLAYERLEDEPRPISHYLEVRRLRTDPETAFKYALAEHQLAPQMPQSVIDARNAKRRELATQRRQKQREATEWGIRKELERSGMRKELWPAFELSEPEEVDVPMPLPEEMESGEVDLAELLDAIEALQLKKEAELDKMVSEQQPMLAAMQEITSGNAEPEAIDRLLAMLDRPEIAAQLDSELARIPGAVGMAIDTATPEGAGAAALDKAKDWRLAALEATRPKVDETAQLALARARFLGLPEGGALERVRKQLSEERFSLPELPELNMPPAAPAEPGGGTLDDALRALEQSPFVPPEQARQIREVIDSADATLAKLLPNLAPDGGSALRALIPAEPPPAASLDQALAETGDRLRRTHAEAHARLDEAESQVAAGMAQLRLASPRATKPEVPLAPGVAQALGELVVQQFSAGIALAGRDLAGADLSGRDLSGADLTGAFLENAILDGASLRGAILVNATLTNASLRGADLGGCDLTRANLCKVDGRGARFDGARLVETMLVEAELSEACFDGAELRSLQWLMVPFSASSFRGATIADLIVMRSDLAGTNWQGATIERLQLLDSSIEGAVFAEARLHEACFLMAKAAGTDFSDTQLSSVLFAGDVDLRRARFCRASAAGLTFQKADLTGASFVRGRLESLSLVEAVLRRANFREASLKRSLFSRNDCASTDFFAANLLEAQFNRADLTGASLRAANLFGADLGDAILYGADLTRANLSRTILAVASDVG